MQYWCRVSFFVMSVAGVFIHMTQIYSGKKNGTSVSLLLLTTDYKTPD